MLNLQSTRFALVVLASGFALCAQAMDMMTAADGTMTDAKGMTLYTFDNDTGGKSMCNGPCATNWPPLIAGADAKPMGKMTIITRDDGTKQWALNGKPLYTYSKDAAPADKKGDGFKNVWHVAK
jgi:predicted lipoprotein with Yx(FWY)xxD motif